MLNGFGNAAEIETLRAGMASEFGIGAAYSGADIGKPDQIAEMVAYHGGESARSTSW